MARDGPLCPTPTNERESGGTHITWTTQIHNTPIPVQQIPWLAVAVAVGPPRPGAMRHMQYAHAQEARQRHATCTTQVEYVKKKLRLLLTVNKATGG